jgi:hypothetical protein
MDAEYHIEFFAHFAPFQFPVVHNDNERRTPTPITFLGRLLTTELIH